MTTGEHIDGAVNSGRFTVEDVGVNHGGLHVFMPKELLHRSNILTALPTSRMPVLSGDCNGKNVTPRELAASASEGQPMNGLNAFRPLPEPV